MGAGIVHHFSKAELEAADEAAANAVHDKGDDQESAAQNGDITALKEKHYDQETNGKINGGYHTAPSDDTRL